MSFDIDRNYSGFNLIRKESLTELNSLGLLFQHEVTGAELMVIENDDDNKVFSITFRTPPGDDCGTAHILEHSVLCGSRKFPAKEPFIEMVKGSLQTFLNAMTFPDKTMYPVASRNLKDFYNLMDVYLDAVLHPKLTEETFMQEGWHYELDTPESDIVYKGVVFNEMKGVFSSPENIIERYLSKSLFPSTIYGNESGGDPEAIPGLTYTAFKEFHARHYHPSNSRIFIYGDGDTRGYLKFLQNQYLKDFKRADISSSIATQRKLRKPRRKVISYPVSKGESLEKKTYVLIGFKLGKATDDEHCLAFTILGHLLLGMNASPLRKALIDSGLGSEVVGGGFDDHRSETVFGVGLKGVEPEQEEKILDIIFSTLRDLADKGIEENMVLSAVNSIDFSLREANFGGYPKGIVYNMRSLGSWLHDADPFMHLKYEQLMKKIRQKSKNGYFEKLIREFLLENTHQSILVGTPKPGLAEKRDAKVRKKLRDYKASLSAEDLQKLVEQTQRLKELQMMPDSPEALGSLPALELEDIPRAAERYPMELKNQDSPKILFHDLFTNNIGYVQIGFNTRTIPLEKIPYIPLLGKLVMGMGTRSHSYVEISQLLGIHTGGIRPWHFTAVPLNDRSNILSHVFFSGKALMEKLGNLFDLYQELFSEYHFDDHKRLLEIVKGAKSDMEDSIIPSGNHYVATRLQSYQSPLGRYNELTDGLTYYRFLQDLLKRVEKNPAEVAEEFKSVARLLFTRKNTLVNITAPGEAYEKFETRVAGLMQSLSDQISTPAKLLLNANSLNEAFLTASSVQYVGKGANLYDLGFEYSGKFDALSSLLRASYLWDRVRVRGGAYGSHNSFDVLSGDFTLVSYRDPNLTETLNTYDEIADYLDTLDLSDDEMTKIVIGCIGNLDPPVTPDRKGTISMIEHLTGRSYELKQKRREELLTTRVQDLRAFAPLFKQIRESGHVCVLGNEDKIKKEKSHFKHLVKVFD